MSDIETMLKDHSETVLKKVNEAVTGTNEVKHYMMDLERKVNRRDNWGSATPDTVGSQFASQKSADLAMMGRADRVAFETKASITSATTDAAGSAGALVVPTRDTLAGMPQRRLTIRNLLNVVQVDSGSVEYPRLKTRPTGADMVAEAALKPESDMQFALEQAPIRTIAHWVKASRQILDDEPQLKGIIDTELRYGLALIEEAQLLYGDGTDQNLLGMIPQATEFDNALRESGDTRIDTIGRAILQASLTDLPPDGIIVHPADWWAMRLQKDADGKYILGDPMQNVPNNLFGLPVIPTKEHNLGDFTVGAFGAQTLYDRWTARIEVGFVNDDFTRNLVTILGEERIGFAAKQPQAIIAGQFTAA